MILELDISPQVAAVDVETPAVAINPQWSEAVGLVISPGPPGPPGPPGEGSPIFGELLSGALDGVNTVFTTGVAYRANTTAVYLNGLRESDYSETSSTTITFIDPPLSTDTIRIDYIIQ